MIVLNGMPIRRVIRMECSADLDYKTMIEFFIDKRLDGVTDYKQFEKDFKVVTDIRKDSEHIDTATVYIPNTQISIKTN